MKATLLKTQEQVSKYGGKFYYAFFKNEEGKSFRSCLYPNCRNFKNWVKFIGREGILLDNLNTKGQLIDADSKPIEISNYEKTNQDLT